VSRWRLGCLAGGLGAIVVAFGPQVERYAEASLTGHMVQHLLVTMLAAPLLVLGWPAARMMVAWPGRTPPPRPLLVVAAYTAVTLGWHLPAAYDAAVARPALHAVMHASMLGAALLLWWTVAGAGRRGAFGHGAGILVVFVAALQHAGLASLLLFAPVPLYAQAASLDDQRLAAVVMATPAKLVYGLAVVILVFAWLATVERRTTKLAMPEKLADQRETQR
jgi:putative membrane protein